MPITLLEKVAQKENPKLAVVLANTNKIHDIVSKNKDTPHIGIHQIDQVESSDAEFINKIRQSNNCGHGGYQGQV
jgi:hypothetical protein